jgi:uncharacterized protein YkwD
LLLTSCGGGSAVDPNPNPQNQLPVAALAANVTTGESPLTVTFSAVASSDPDGTITAFDWDLDGNGSFETSTGTTGTVQRIYVVAGSITVRVRVTDNRGGTGVASLQITVTSPAGFDPSFDTPPVESFSDNSAPGDSLALAWRKNSYHTLPLAFDIDRVFQNEGLKRWADEILRLTNIERAANGGLAPLVRDNHLEMVMQAHCREMALRGYFNHNTPEGLNPFQRLDAINPPFYTAAGENIAAGQDSPQAVVTGWMNSPGHRANILNPSFRRVGIGVYFHGPDAFQFYFGQLFGTFGNGIDPDSHDWIEIDEAP